MSGLGFLNDIASNPAIIIDRIGIGHTRNRRKSARDCRLGTGLDGFLILITWLTKMYMQVNKPRRDNAALGVNITLSTPSSLRGIGSSGCNPGW
jgi:hypothetical protein